MNDTHRYAEAMRTIVAGLGMLHDHACAAGVGMEHTDLIYALKSRLRDEIPPWGATPNESGPVPWSTIVPGDRVKAPNGQWYHVDSVARLDTERMAVLLTGGIRSTPNAKDMVPVRRGDAGRAVDLFRAGGLELEVIGK